MYMTFVYICLCKLSQLENLFLKYNMSDWIIIEITIWYDIWYVNTAYTKKEKKNWKLYIVQVYNTI